MRLVHGLRGLERNGSGERHVRTARSPRAQTYTLTCTGRRQRQPIGDRNGHSQHPAADGGLLHGTSGTLALNVNAVRGSGISPFWCSSTPVGTTTPRSPATPRLPGCHLHMNFATPRFGTDTWRTAPIRCHVTVAATTAGGGVAVL